jgi:glycosidase
MYWFERANFYQFYPLAYAHGDYSLSELEMWSEHLKSLKINAVYLSPLFQSLSHGYDTTDYFRVDERLGDNNTLTNLVDNFHRNGIKVVLDCVFNHVGRDFFAFKDLKEQRENSKYINWFKNVDFSKNNNFNDGFCYDGWEGVDSLVLLNHECDEVIEYLLSAIRFWKREFHIDGLRFDVAYSLPISFIKKINKTCKEGSAEFFTLGEVIHGDYSKFVGEGLFDSVTDYELHQALYNSHKTENYFELAHTMKRQFEEGIGSKLYNFVDNHDVDRLASKIGNKENLYLAYAILYTIPGIPALYNGDEWGEEGKKTGSDDSKLRPYFYINDLHIKNDQLLAMVKNLAAVREKYQNILFDGTIKIVVIENKYMEYERELNGKKIRVYLNQGDDSHNISGDFKSMIEGRNYSFNKTHNYLLPHGFLIVEV